MLEQVVVWKLISEIAIFAFDITIYVSLINVSGSKQKSLPKKQ